MKVLSAESGHLEDVFRILVSNGWAHRIADVEHLKRLVEASQRTAVALIDDKVVGFARAITDGLSNGYLSMVVVNEAHRRQGVGRALVQHIIDRDEAVTWMLSAGRSSAPEFFARLGFVASRDAMERLRP